LDSLRIQDNVEILQEKALFLREERLVVIADLHLGYEGVLQRKGISIPRKQKLVILEMLKQITDRYSPKTIVVNGDLKHNFSKNLDEEWLEVKEVLKFIDEQTKLIVVKGNHDNFLASILRDMDIELRKSYRVGRFILTHGHMDVKTRGKIVIGHEHPALKLRDEIGAIISLPAFLIGDDIIVLPAFSPLALGVDLSSYPYLSPILNSRRIDNAKVIGIDENEGLLDFGPVSKLKGHNASLILK